MVVHACEPSTQETEVRGLRVPGQPGLWKWDPVQEAGRKGIKERREGGKVERKEKRKKEECKDRKKEKWRWGGREKGERKWRTEHSYETQGRDLGNGVWCRPGTQHSGLNAFIYGRGKWDLKGPAFSRFHICIKKNIGTVFPPDVLTAITCDWATSHGLVFWYHKRNKHETEGERGMFGGMSRRKEESKHHSNIRSTLWTSGNLSDQTEIHMKYYQ